MSKVVRIFDRDERREKVREALSLSRGFGAPASTTTADAIRVTLPAEPEVTPPQLRIDDLIDKANDALSTMSKANKNRWLILQMGEAINELVRRVETAEAELRLLKARQP